MIEITLCSVIVALLVEIGYITHENKREVERLTKALIAKNLTDYTSNAIIEKDKPSVKLTEPDLIPMEEVSDKLFNQVINLK
jgi:hypothetical protein